MNAHLMTPQKIPMSVARNLRLRIKKKSFREENLSDPQQSQSCITLRGDAKTHGPNIHVILGLKEERQ